MQHSSVHLCAKDPSRPIEQGPVAVILTMTLDSDVPFPRLDVHETLIIGPSRAALDLPPTRVHQLAGARRVLFSPGFHTSVGSVNNEKRKKSSRGRPLSMAIVHAHARDPWALMSECLVCAAGHLFFYAGRSRNDSEQLASQGANAISAALPCGSQTRSGYRNCSLSESEPDTRVVFAWSF